MPPRRKAPAAKAKASKAAPPPPDIVDNNEATQPAPQQQQNEPSPVAALFNRAQEAGTAAAAKRLADLLWSAWARQAHENNNGDDAFWLELERCTSHLLVNVPQVRGREEERERGNGGVVEESTVFFSRRWRRICPILPFSERVLHPRSPITSAPFSLIGQREAREIAWKFYLT